MTQNRIFGHIAGVPVGASFPDRWSLHKAGIHRPLQAGISGSQHEGADSIVVSGGYEDDEDFGDRLIYTGHGGNNPTTGEQVADQQLTRQNLALVVSERKQLPVRVIRGAGGHPAYSPLSGYRYDGLYRVKRHWSEQGRSGFRIWRFELSELADQSKAPMIPFTGVDQPSASESNARSATPNTFICFTCRRRLPSTEMSLATPGRCNDCQLEAR